MRRALLPVFCVLLIGCRSAYLDVEGNVNQRASIPVDLMVEPVQEPSEPTIKELPKPTGQNRETRTTDVQYVGAAEMGEIMQTSWQKEAGPVVQDKKFLTMMDRLKMPEDLRRLGGPDIQMPPANANAAQIKQAIAKQFPPLPKLPTLPDAQQGPTGKPWNLSDLQDMALRGNPTIRQAHLDVEAARGAAVQVGLYPNTVVGYEGDTLGQANSFGQRSAGQQGVFLEQVFITGGKLQLARQAAERDVKIAEQKVKQIESEVQTQIRTYYFAVLSARKNFEIARSLAKLTDEVFNVLLLQLEAGEVAAYEPMQIRVLAMQSRGLLIQSYNRYVASWKQLAAATGAPSLALTELAGQIDMSVPHFEYDAVLEYVLRNHTDVVNAGLSVDRDRTLLRLAEVQPIPNVSVHLSLLKDTTSFPHYPMQNVFASVPVPIFNRNQGAIYQARAMLQRSMQENFRVRNDLSSRVAEVFQRYENNRMLLDMYKKQMLPNQVQAFRAAIVRHAAVGGKDVSYNDVVTVQQNLANLLGNYLVALNDQWTAVIDIAALMQTKDLFLTQRVDEVAPVPNVMEIIREVQPKR